MGCCFRAKGNRKVRACNKERAWCLLPVGLCGQPGWEFHLAENGVCLLSQFLASWISNLVLCGLMWSPTLRGGERAGGGGKGRTSPFDGSLHLDKHKAIVTLGGA